MAHKFTEIAFTPSVREVQKSMGSRDSYASMDADTDYNQLLSEHEAGFISARDSFYMASVSETGWPYVQHRGGPAGFIKVIDAQTLGFADYSGNRQYISTGNLRTDNRVSLFFMDYPNRTRLKLFGRVEIIETDELERLARLEDNTYRAQVERGFIIHIEGFDWNCPQHITPRFTETDVQQHLQPLLAENESLKQQLADLKNSKPSSLAHNPDDADASHYPDSLGDGPLPLIISGLKQLTPRIRAYELKHKTGQTLPEVSAGSHLPIPVLLANGQTELRYYSICSHPTHKDRYQIAVLREPQSRGGSEAIHQHFNLGLQLNCELPDNYFPLHQDSRPAILITGGIGITPIKTMAETLQLRGTSLHLHYAGRNIEEMAFADELTKRLRQDLTCYDSAQQQRMDFHRIITQAPNDAVFYLCGPNRLIDGFQQVATKLNINQDRIQVEQFSGPSNGDEQVIELRLERSNMELQVGPDQSILDALLDNGIDADYGCRTGQCKSCALTVLDGQADHRDQVLSENEKSQQCLITPCVSRAKSKHLVLDI